MPEGAKSEAGAPEGKQARRIFVAGEVQGVGYRYFARHAAEEIGVRGYVKNLSDGGVEVYAIGTPVQLDRLIDELRRGPRHATVGNVTQEEAGYLQRFASHFAIEPRD